MPTRKPGHEMGAFRLNAGLRRRYRGLGSIVGAEPMNPAKMLRLAKERGVRVIIKHKAPGARHGVQTAPVEVVEIETTSDSPQPKVIFYSGIKDRKKAVALDRIISIHPDLRDPEGA